MADMNEQLPPYMQNAQAAPPIQQPVQQQQQPPAQQQGLDSEGFAPITDAQIQALTHPSQPAQPLQGQSGQQAQSGQEALPPYMQAAGGQAAGPQGSPDGLTFKEAAKQITEGGLINALGRGAAAVAPYVTPLGEGTLALKEVPIIGRWLKNTGAVQDVVRGAEDWLDGRGVLQTAARGAGQGAGVGGVTSITDAEDGKGFHPIDNAVTGAVTGGVLGGALGGASKGIDKLAERFSSEEARAAESLGEKHGVPVYTTDVSPPTSAVGKWGQRTLEQAPFFNTAGMRRGQQEAREHLAAEVKARFTDSDSGYAPDQLVDNVLRKDKAIRNRANKRYGQIVEAISDKPISSQNTISKIDQQIKELTTSPGGAPLQNVDTATINRLQAISNDIKADPSFANLQRIRTNFRENVRGQNMIWPDSHDRMSKAVYASMSQDLKNGVGTHLGKAGLNKWATANQELRDESIKVKETVLKRVFNNGEATPEVAGRLLMSGDKSAQRQLFKGLSPKGRSTALSGLIQHAVEKSTNVDGYLSPTGLAKALKDKKIKAGIDIFGDAESRQYLEGVTNILNKTRQAQAAQASPQTGERVINFLTAMHPVMAFKTGMAGLFGKLYESPTTRKIVMKLANKNLKPGHVNKLLNGLGEESGLHQELRNAPNRPVDENFGTDANQARWINDARGGEAAPAPQMTTSDYARQASSQAAQGANPWQQEAAGMAPAPQPTGPTPEAMTRGIRNNNPLNLRSNIHNMWKGKAGDVDGFVKFYNPESGLRAAVKTMKSYRKSGRTTISGIIKRWAPASENDTASYIQNVERMTGINRNRPLTNNDFPQVIKAMGHIESGADLNEGEIQKMWNNIK